MYSDSKGQKICRNENEGNIHPYLILEYPYFCNGDLAVAEVYIFFSFCKMRNIIIDF